MADRKACPICRKSLDDFDKGWVIAGIFFFLVITLGCISIVICQAVRWRRRRRQGEWGEGGRTRWSPAPAAAAYQGVELALWPANAAWLMSENLNVTIFGHRQLACECSRALMWFMCQNLNVVIFEISMFCNVIHFNDFMYLIYLIYHQCAPTMIYLPCHLTIFCSSFIMK